MEFSITRYGGQYQFWHTDCDKSRSGIMTDPKFLPDDFKEFKCLHCKKVGIVQLDKIVEGSGTLVTPFPQETAEYLNDLTKGEDIDLDAPLDPADE